MSAPEGTPAVPPPAPVAPSSLALRPLDVAVAALAGLGAGGLVQVLSSPLIGVTVRSGQYDANAVLNVVLGLIATILGTAVAVAVHDVRLTPDVRTGPVEWLVVGLLPALVGVLGAILATVGWGDLGGLGTTLGVQVLYVVFAAGVALATGALLRSRAASRTPVGPPPAAQ